MREIKFRAWDKFQNVMFNFDIYNVPPYVGQTYLVGEKFERIYEIMQYTGLKDKNGTEIYEGDIVEVASKDLKFQVVYEAHSFNRKWIDDISKRYREHLTEPLAWNTYIICEVIGNIYEHPELLGDSQ